MASSWLKFHLMALINCMCYSTNFSIPTTQHHFNGSCKGADKDFLALVQFVPRPTACEI